MGRRNRTIKSEERVEARRLDQEWRTAIYARLSMENNGLEDERSLDNQIRYVEEYIQKHPSLKLVDVYVDNGFSGTNFSRAQFLRLMDDLKVGRINCIVVKDLSRFGRNYLEAGYYLEKIFPFLNIRFIAINDNYDSMDETKKDSLIVPIKNLVNDIYSKDLSRKISGTMRMKEKKGEIWYGVPAYGYWRKPDQPFRMETDEETAPYVRLMFQWTLSGMSYAEIAFRLNQLQAITPTMRLAQRGHYKEESARLHTTWAVTSVKTILHNPVYMGDTIYNRSYQCVRDGTAHAKRPRDQWFVIPKTHEALVYRKDFEKVAQLLDKRNEAQAKKIKNNAEVRATSPDVLSGLFYCADCGRKMFYYRDIRKGKVKFCNYYCNPGTNQKAQTNNPDTFSDFTDAMKAYAMGGYDGIGIRVASGIGAIDIDHCIREDGTLNDVAASVLGIFKDAYFERSPSGSGLRGFFQVDADYIFDKTVYYINNRTHGLEVYLPGATNRFVTVTGNQYRSGSVPHDMTALQTVLDTFMKRKSQVTNSHIEPCSYLSDEQVLEHARASTNGERFMDYYNGDWRKYFDNQSDADMGFVSMLCFWCGCDEEQIDRIFRSSGMMRPKWDRRQAGTTYGAITIRNAIASCQTIYLPVRASDLSDPADEFDDIEEYQAADFKADVSRITLTLEEMKPHSNPRYGRDEIGIGNAFADFFRPIARFNRDRGIWYVYDGRIWRPDEGGLKVAELAKLLADKLYTFALQIKDEDVRNRYIKRVQKLQLRKNRRTMVEDAKSVHPIPMSAFDQNTDLFNCQNGTLNLKTLQFQEHRPEDFLTMVSGVTYDPAASCPRWLTFIREVMCGDQQLASYLQRALGYALSGDTTLECLFILYGATSRNGKGTTMETFLKIMGDYGKTSNPEMLSTKFGNTNASGPSEEIARLAGIRFVNISEPEKKITFNAALVKRLTGNDTINARYLHENSFDFKPVFKIFINTNYLPNVSDMTLFDSGRLKIIPFKRHFKEAEQDKGLKALFAEEDNLSGIFNWCLEGYKAFRRERLESPKAVIDAIQEYRNDSDRIGQFIEAWLEEGDAFEVRSSAAYKLYSDWCKKYNYNAENVKNFKNAMEKRFSIVRRRPKDGGEKTSLIIGCRFREQELGEDAEEPEVLQGAKSDFKALRCTE